MNSLVAREYLRVSVDRDGLSRSTSQQHDENAKAVAAQGWQLHPEPYEDDGVSASRYATRTRAGFKLLLADLDAGRFSADLLVLWESSRGSRRVSEWVTLVEACEDQGVQIFVTTHGRAYDPANPRDRRSLLEDAVDSEYESAKSSKRIRRAIRARADAGGVHGKNLYGYRRVYDPQTRAMLRIEPDPEQAPVVQEAARRVLAGETHYQIAKSFNERGYAPRRASYKEHRKHLGWTPVAIRQMLEMPAYAGLRTYHGEVLGEAQWPALIPREQWEELTALFKKRSRKGARDWTVKHLMAGLAVCGVCGAQMRVGKQNKGRRVVDPVTGELGPQQHYNVYQCQGAPGRTGFHVAIKEEHLDTIVSELVIDRVSRRDFLARVGTRDRGADDKRAALIAEIDRYRAYLDEVRAKAAEQMRLELLLDQEARIVPKLKDAQRRLESLAATDPSVLELARSTDVRGSWEAMDIEARRRVIRALLQPQVARAAKRGSRGVEAAKQRVQPGWK